jgi:hypothetical protein
MKFARKARYRQINWHRSPVCNATKSDEVIPMMRVVPLIGKTVAYQGTKNSSTYQGLDTDGGRRPARRREGWRQ